MGPFSHRGGAGSLSLFGEFTDNISPFFASDSTCLVAFPAFTAETYVSGMAAVLWIDVLTFTIGTCVRWVRAERELAFIVRGRELFTRAFQTCLLFDSPLVTLVVGFAPDLVAFKIFDVRILGSVNAHHLAGSVIGVPLGEVRRCA